MKFEASNSYECLLIPTKTNRTVFSFIHLTKKQTRKGNLQSEKSIVSNEIHFINIQTFYLRVVCAIITILLLKHPILSLSNELKPMSVNATSLFNFNQQEKNVTV